MENSLRIKNMETQVKDITGLTKDFTQWVKTKDAQDAFFLWMDKQEKQAALEAFGSKCATCHMKDLSACQCYAGHLQRTQGIPVTECEDYKTE